MAGTGVSVVKSETVNRKGKGEDSVAKTRKVKLGWIFTQTTFDKIGMARHGYGILLMNNFMEQFRLLN